MWNIKTATSQQTKHQTRPESPYVVNPQGKADTSTVISSSRNPSDHGEKVIFSIKVTRFGSFLGIPGGTADIKEGNLSIASDIPINSLGEACFETSSLSSGSHSILAIRRESQNFKSSISPAITQVVNKAHTLTELVSSNTCLKDEETVCFVATVKPVNPKCGTPNGTIDFIDGDTILAENAKLDINGQANLDSIALSNGKHFIIAIYKGSDCYNSSESNVVEQVAGEIEADSSEKFDPHVKVEVSVESDELSNGYNGHRNSEENILNTPDYKAGSSSSKPDPHPQYSENVSESKTVKANMIFEGSTSEAIKQTVDKADTVTVIKPSNDSLILGEKITLTAEVEVAAPGAGTPDGSVDFKDGETILAEGIALDNLGQASLGDTSLSKGIHAITATYRGNGNFNSSISPEKLFKVSKVATRVVVSSSKISSLFGEKVLLTVNVSSEDPGPVTPTSSVDIHDGNATIAADVALDSSGQAFCEISSIPIGDHSIYAIYKENAQFEGSISPVIIHTVNKASTLTTVASSKSSIVFGERVRFTAKVISKEPQAGVPDGMVDFKDEDGYIAADVPLDGEGQAVCDFNFLTAGNHYIAAVYKGSSNYSGSDSK